MSILLRQPHHYPGLIKRWRAVARSCRRSLHRYATLDGFDLYALDGRHKASNAPLLYFSAGIHGDEAAATEGLICWAEARTDLLRNFPFLIFPCLNPWGLTNNSRLDARGRDLNRCYRRRTTPINEHRRVIGRDVFDLALTLHEDFDARGVYIYEVPSRKPYWAEHLIRAAQPFVPPDSRPSIEGRRAKNGVVRRAIRPDTIPDWPEAFFLHFGHAHRTFTIETPSEFHLEQRVAAQVSIIDAAVGLALAEARKSVETRRPSR